METNKKIARALSRLVQANRNRKEAYRKVYHNVDDAQFKRFCNKWFSKSLRNMSTISAIATEDGLNLTEWESLADKTARLLTATRIFASALTKKVIIHFCESGEHQMVRIYDEVLETIRVDINPALLNELMAQRLEFIMALDELNRFAVTKGHFAPVLSSDRIPLEHLT
jgi:hypothetical protein